jgi:septal ring factor EnvC (AmiA/AmiB activator)
MAPLEDRGPARIPMELEQLVSFVRYQRGQKQGWDSLDEVMTVVLEAKERVDAAEATVLACTKQVEEIKGSLIQLDVTLVNKKAEVEAALAKAYDGIDEKIASHKVEAERAVKGTFDLLNDIKGQTAAAQADLEVVRAEWRTANAEKTKVESDLAAVRKVLADIKATL